MRIISLSTLKGGQGKSSLSILLAKESERRGFKTLVVDLDAQSSLTDYFLRDEEAGHLFSNNVYHFLIGLKSLDEVKRKQNHLHILPSALNLSGLGAIKSNDPLSLMDNKASFQNLNYDLIIIDSPPSPSYEFRLAISSSNIVITPILYDRWSLQGHSLLQEEANRLKRAGLFTGSIKIIPSICTPSEEKKIREIFESEEIFKQSFLKKTSIKNAINNGEPLKEKNFEETEMIKNIFEELIR